MILKGDIIIFILRKAVWYFAFPVLLLPLGGHARTQGAEGENPVSDVCFPQLGLRYNNVLSYMNLHSAWAGNTSRLN